MFYGMFAHIFMHFSPFSLFPLTLLYVRYYIIYYNHKHIHIPIYVYVYASICIYFALCAGHATLCLGDTSYDIKHDMWYVLYHNIHHHHDYIYAYVYDYIYVYIYAYMCVRVYIRIYTHNFLSMRRQTWYTISYWYIETYICLYTYLYICLYICLWIHYKSCLSYPEGGNRYEKAKSNCHCQPEGRYW